MKKSFFLIPLLVACVLALGEEDRNNQIKIEAQDKLESGFEKTAIGAVEVGVGVWRAAQGDVIGATAAAIDGSNRIKDGIFDFQESKKLFDASRDNDICQDPLLDTFRGPFEREY